ncbi:MAG: TRAP transporter substrate-binding protein [Hyphomicrobiaceae bacterium]|nr:TRAP transporter substrate-binding protein [Hyphomicrobiaceae bacterium]
MRRRPAIVVLAAACALLGAAAGGARALEPATKAVTLRVLGGLANIRQYTVYEEPFWSKEVPALSGGRIKTSIDPFDRSGVRGQDMLQLVRLGVAPLGTALVSQISVDEPILSAADLPGLNPDLATLKANLARLRPLMAEVLRTRHNVELLGVYSYPAQVAYCSKPFAHLNDLAGRRIRTASVGQSEMLAGLGAIPVILAFADVPAALRKGVVDCAVTGTLSGFEIGLADATTHVHAMALTWGISIFGANVDAWQALPDDVRAIVREGVSDLERRIWEGAERDTATGLECNAGRQDCGRRLERPLTIIPTSSADESVRQRLLRDVVVPAWIDRCGAACERLWTEVLAPALDGASAAEASTIRP